MSEERAAPSGIRNSIVRRFSLGGWTDNPIAAQRYATADDATHFPTAVVGDIVTAIPTPGDFHDLIFTGAVIAPGVVQITAKNYTTMDIPLPPGDAYDLTVEVTRQ